MKHLNFLVLIVFLAFFSCKKSDVPTGEPDFEVRNFVCVLEKNIGSLMYHLEIDSVQTLNHLALIPQNSPDWPGDEIYLTSLLESSVGFIGMPDSQQNRFLITEKNLVLVPDDYTENTKLYTLAKQEDKDFLKNVAEPLVYFGKSNTFFLPIKYYSEIAVKIKDQSKIRIVIGDKMLETVIKPNYSSTINPILTSVFNYTRRNKFFNSKVVGYDPFVNWIYILLNFPHPDLIF